MAKQNKSRKFVASSATAALVASAIVPVASAAVNDLDTVAPYAQEAVQYLVDNGVVQGDNNGNFNAKSTITRAEAATIFANYFELEAGEENPFTDVKADAWYTDAITGAYAAGLVNGLDENTFGPLKTLTRAEAATLLVRAFKLEGAADLSDFADAEGLAEWKTEALAVAVEYGVITGIEKNGELYLDADAPITREQFATIFYRTLDATGLIGGVEEVEIVSVSAINAKTIAVTFNTSVEDTTKAVFSVKKGASTLTPEISWNEDNTVAYLALSGKITEGEYAVTVTGLSEEALTGSVKAENEKVSEIKVTSTDAVITDNGDGVTVTYQVLNQYGEDVTKTSLASNLSFTSPQGTITAPSSANRGVITVSLTAPKAGDKVTVVIVDKNTGVTATQTLNVVEKAAVDTITLGELYHAKGLELSEDNKTGHYILVDAKDQYGNAVTDLEKVNAAFTMISTDELVVAKAAIEKIVIDDKEVLAIPVTTTKAGTATITAVSTATGKTTQKTVTVAAGVTVDTITIGDAEGTVSGSKKILLPVEITNTKGEVITNKADVKNLELSTSVEGVVPTLVEKDGALYIEVTTQSVAPGKQDVLVVTAKTPTQKVVTKVLTVKANAVATEIVGVDSDVSFTVLSGQNLVIADEDFIVNDQYGDRITDKTKYDITAVLAENSTVNSVGDKVTLNGLTKTQNVTFKIKDATTESSIEKKVTVVKVADFASYEVSTDLGTVHSAATTTASAYAKELKVYGVTASGQKVELPANSSDFAVEAGKYLEYKNGKVVVHNAEGLSATPATGEKVSDTDKLKVIINATGEVFEVNATVSAEAPKAKTILVTEDGTKKGNAVTSIEEKQGTLDKADLVSNLYVEDQYGVEFNATDGIKLTFTSLVDNGTKGATISGNGTFSAAVSFFGIEDTVNVKITLDDATATVTAKGTIEIPTSEQN